MVIISAYKADLTKEENAKRSHALLCDLLNLVKWDAAVFPVEGSWEGVSEEAYMVRIQDTADDDTINRIAEGIYELASDYDQECVGGINLECCPPRMSTIDVTTREYRAYGIGVSLMEPPAMFPNWVKIQDRYYFLTMDLTDDETIARIFQEYAEQVE